METVRTISHYSPRGICEDFPVSSKLVSTLDDFDSQRRKLLSRLSSPSDDHRKSLVVIRGNFNNPVVAMNSFANSLVTELKESKDLKQAKKLFCDSVNNFFGKQLCDARFFTKWTLEGMQSLEPSTVCTWLYSFWRTQLYGNQKREDAVASFCKELIDRQLTGFKYYAICARLFFNANLNCQNRVKEICKKAGIKYKDLKWGSKIPCNYSEYQRVNELLALPGALLKEGSIVLQAAFDLAEGAAAEGALKSQGLYGMGGYVAFAKANNWDLLKAYIVMSAILKQHGKSCADIGWVSVALSVAEFMQIYGLVEKSLSKDGSIVLQAAFDLAEGAAAEGAWKSQGLYGMGGYVAFAKANNWDLHKAYIVMSAILKQHGKSCADIGWVQVPLSVAEFMARYELFKQAPQTLGPFDTETTSKILWNLIVREGVTDIQGLAQMALNLKNYESQLREALLRDEPEVFTRLKEDNPIQFKLLCSFNGVRRNGLVSKLLPFKTERSRGEFRLDFTIQDYVPDSSVEISLVAILLDLINNGLLDPYLTATEKDKLIQFFLNDKQPSEQLEGEVIEILGKSELRTLISEKIEIINGER